MKQMNLFLTSQVCRATSPSRWSELALGLVFMFATTASAIENIPGFGAGPITHVGATSYDFVVDGDATGHPVEGTNELYNSFADPSKSTDASQAGSTIIYDPISNTSIIRFYGAPAIALSAGPPPVTAWFGVNGYTGKVLKQYWDLDGVPLGIIKPGGGFTANANHLALSHVAVIRANLTSDFGALTDMWAVVPVPASGAGGITFTAGDLDLTLSNVGYFLSDAQVLMTNLSATYPDPGQPGSPFKPLAALEGMHVAANQSISGIAIPEPGSLLLATAGVLGLALALRRRPLVGNFGDQ